MFFRFFLDFLCVAVAFCRLHWVNIRAVVRYHRIVRESTVVVCCIYWLCLDICVWCWKYVRVWIRDDAGFVANVVTMSKCWNGIFAYQIRSMMQHRAWIIVFFRSGQLYSLIVDWRYSSLEICLFFLLIFGFFLLFWCVFFLQKSNKKNYTFKLPFPVYPPAILHRISVYQTRTVSKGRFKICI